MLRECHRPGKVGRNQTPFRKTSKIHWLLQDWVCSQAEWGFRWVIVSFVGQDVHSYIYSRLSFYYFFLINTIIITFAS